VSAFACQRWLISNDIDKLFYTEEYHENQKATLDYCDP